MWGECVFIGRVGRQLGLKVSSGAAHRGPLTAHRAPKANRGQAAAILERKVVLDPSLLDVLLDLEDGSIACTCPLAA